MTTFQRLKTIRKPDSANDTLSQSSVAAVESTAADYEDFLAGMLSQFRHIVGGTDWYSSVEGAATDPRSLKTLTDGLYFKSILRQRTVLAHVTVPVGQNYVVLSVADAQAPAEVAAVGGGTGAGAVVASVAGAAGAHSLAVVAGSSPIAPKNLVVICDPATLDPLISGGREVFALLQAASAVVDGDAFDDATRRVQLSFVRLAASGDALEVASATDVGGKEFRYAYVSRVQLSQLNEQDLLPNALGGGGGGGGGSLILSGDVAVTGTAAKVVGLQSTPVSPTAPAADQILRYDGAAWSPYMPPHATSIEVACDPTIAVGQAAHIASVGGTAKAVQALASVMTPAIGIVTGKSGLTCTLTLLGPAEVTTTEIAGPLYVGLDGFLTPNIPVGPAMLQQLGVANGGGQVLVQPQQALWLVD